MFEGYDDPKQLSNFADLERDLWIVSDLICFTLGAVKEKIDVKMLEKELGLEYVDNTVGN